MQEDPLVVNQMLGRNRSALGNSMTEAVVPKDRLNVHKQMTQN